LRADEQTYLTKIVFFFHSFANAPKHVKLPPVHSINPLNAELNPICHFLALLAAHHILHISRIMVKACRRRRSIAPLILNLGTT
jgi:hypothetical protein